MSLPYGEVRKQMVSVLGVQPCRPHVKFVAGLNLPRVTSVDTHVLLCMSISVPMNAAAIEFRKHAILGNRGAVAPQTQVPSRMCWGVPRHRCRRSACVWLT